MAWNTPNMKTTTLTLTGAAIKAAIPNLTLDNTADIILETEFFDAGDIVVGCIGRVTSTFGIGGVLNFHTSVGAPFPIGSIDMINGTPQNPAAFLKITDNINLEVNAQVFGGVFSDILDSGSIDLTFLSFTP